MNTPTNLEALQEVKGLKLVHLNVRSLPKKIDQLRLMLRDCKIDVFTASETWLKPYITDGIVEVDGYSLFRLDRNYNTRNKKRGGGLVTYVHDKYTSSCESLTDLDVSNENIEAQWMLLQCKNIVICNVYRPPNGDLRKAITYLDDSLKSFNLCKIDLFMLGDFNVDYKNQISPNFKKFSFFSNSNGLSQYIKATTRNTDKSKTLIDLVLSNSKFISMAWSLELFISDHQPIFVVHKKARDNRKSAQFRGVLIEPLTKRFLENN